MKVRLLARLFLPYKLPLGNVTIIIILIIATLVFFHKDQVSKHENKQRYPYLRDKSETAFGTKKIYVPPRDYLSEIIYGPKICKVEFNYLGETR